MLLTLYIVSSLVFKLFGLVQDVLSFDTRTLTVASDVLGVPVACIVIVLAAISEGVGRTSVVLLVNRLGRKALLVYVVLFGMVFVVGAILVIAVIWLLADMLFNASRPFSVAVRFLGLGYLPLVWSFFVLVPCLGPGVRVLLGVWSIGVMTVIAGWMFGLTLWQALLCTGGGWLLVHQLYQLMRWPSALVERWMWSLTTGSSTHYAPHELPSALPVRSLGIV